MHVWGVFETDYQVDRGVLYLFKTHEAAKAWVKEAEDKRLAAGGWRFPFWDIERIEVRE